MASLFNGSPAHVLIKKKVITTGLFFHDPLHNCHSLQALDLRISLQQEPLRGPLSIDLYYR